MDLELAVFHHYQSQYQFCVVFKEREREYSVSASCLYSSINICHTEPQADVEANYRAVARHTVYLSLRYVD